MATQGRSHAEPGQAPLAGLSRELREALAREVADLHPAYFAMVMATGVLDVSCRLLGVRLLAEILFWINLVAYGLLWLATLLRATFFTDRFLADGQDHQRGPGYFTTVAATCVVGVQFVVLRQAFALAAGLWWLALGLWLVCMYAIFSGLTIKTAKPSLEDGINGGWLTAVVATQSLAMLGCLVAPTLGLAPDAARSEERV